MFVVILSISLVVLAPSLRRPVCGRPGLSLAVLAVEFLVADAVHDVDAGVEQVLDEHSA